MSTAGLDILILPMQDNDAGAETIGDYLIQLLLQVWEDGEGFSGKRPFGNSDWRWDLYTPLVVAGLVDGEFDENGYLDLSSVDRQNAYRLVTEAIGAIDSAVVLGAA